MGSGVSSSNMAAALTSLAILFWGPTLGLATQDFPLMMPNVRPSQEEAYMCTPVRITDTETFYVTGFKPNATAHTAHHMLIYGCEEPEAEEGLELHPPCAKGNQIIYAWAMDAPELKLPPDTGFRMGKDTNIKYLVLQVHYANIDQIRESGDDSGVVLHYTDEEQPQTAGVILLGTGGMAPGHSTTFFETACSVDDARTIHPFAFRTHTHSLGMVVSGWKVTEGKNWDLIGKKSPKDPQMFYPIKDSSMTLTHGDILAARCTWLIPMTMMYTLDRPTRMKCVTFMSCIGSWARNQSKIDFVSVQDHHLGLGRLMPNCRISRTKQRQPYLEYSIQPNIENPDFYISERKTKETTKHIKRAF